MAETESSVSSGSVLVTLCLVAVAIVALSGIDAFLARMERAENRAEALRLSNAGQKLMAQGEPVEAVEQFKSALAMERENPQSWLALGQAQFAAGKLAEAEVTLTELLHRDSTSGDANLALGRVLVKEGRVAEAVSAYHQAIYGHWDQDPVGNQVQVRWELVNLLAQQGSKEELLAELLPLLDVAPEDLAGRKRLGKLFLVAGSPARAGEIFREILRAHPDDAAAYAGLGESEFARGNYLTAHNEFQTAANLRRRDAEIRARLELSSEILALDPMRRGLGPDEQYRRSLRMLELATAATARCSGKLPDAEQAVVDEAQKAIKMRAGPKLSELVEANLNLAEQAWKIRQKECKQAPTSEEDALRLVLARIAQ